MRTNRKAAFHAGDFKNKSENLQIGLHSTSFCSGIFYTLSKEECEYQGAGFNLEHKRPVYSFQLAGLNLFPTSARDCRTLNLFNKSLYYFPVWLNYAGDIDYMIYYKPLYEALQKCFEEYYADEVPENERVNKFIRELEDSYKIEANDITEIDGEHYTLQDYIADTPCLKELQKCVRRIEPDAHNTMPYLTKLMLESNSFEEFDSTSLNESKKLNEDESHLLANVLESIVDDMYNYYLDNDKKEAWLLDDIDRLWDIVESIRSAGYEHDLIVDIEEIEKDIEDNSGNNDEIYDFGRDISQALRDFKYGKEGLYGPNEDVEEMSMFVEKIYYVFDDFTKVSKYATEKQKKDFESNIDRLYKYDYTTKRFVNALDKLDDLADELMDDRNELLQKIGKDLKEKVFSLKFHLDHNLEKPGIAEPPYPRTKIKESRKLRENEEQDRLADELDNFLDKFELATDIDNMLQKVADLVGISKEDITKEAYKIYSKYADLYDKVTGRFDNWSAPKDDLFATQLLKDLGYDGTYPLEDADNTEWGGVVFDLENIKAINPENDEAKSQVAESIRMHRNRKLYRV